MNFKNFTQQLFLNYNYILLNKSYWVWEKWKVSWCLASLDHFPLHLFKTLLIFWVVWIYLIGRCLVYSQKTYLVQIRFIGKEWFNSGNLIPILTENSMENACFIFWQLWYKCDFSERVSPFNVKALTLYIFSLLENH